jgi:hypothetical protein
MLRAMSAAALAASSLSKIITDVRCFLLSDRSQYAATSEAGTSAKIDFAQLGMFTGGHDEEPR